MATASSLFIRAKIIDPEMIQHTVKNTHTCQISALPQRIVPITSNWLPNAVAHNQPPCISPLKRGGATFETKEIPIGLKNSSEIVSEK